VHKFIAFDCIVRHNLILESQTN